MVLLPLQVFLTGQEEIETAYEMLKVRVIYRTRVTELCGEQLLLLSVECDIVTVV